MGVKPPSPSPTLPAPSLSSPFPPISTFSSPALTSRPFKIQLVGLRERSKLPQRGPGRHILSLGNASEGNNFNDFTVFLPTLYYCYCMVVAILGGGGISNFSGVNSPPPEMPRINTGQKPLPDALIHDYRLLQLFGRMQYPKV